MVGHIVLWLFLSIITLGIGTFFFIYSPQKMVMNHTVMINRRGDPIAEVSCDLNVVSSIGHIILWILLTIVTVGLALPFYEYRVNRVVTEATGVVMY